MSTDANPSVKHINPRPGVVQALGVVNIVFSLLTTLFLAFSILWTVLLASGVATTATTTTVPQGSPAPPGAKPSVGFNPFMGMNDPSFLRFTYVDAGTGLILNGLMFASGIGLVNRRRWGATWWTGLAWVKISRLVLLWSFYIVAVAPILSENMARSAIAMMQQQVGNGGGKLPPVGVLIRVYSIMNLILAVSMMTFGSIYPVISLWLMGRPGFKAALVVGKPPREPELS